jgi:hypothetical protein
MLSIFPKLKTYWRLILIVAAIAAIICWKFNQEFLSVIEIIMPTFQQYIIPLFDIVKSLSKLI